MRSASLGIAWIWMLLSGGVGAIPLGGAPRELDPKLSAVAPEHCLWYVSYSGQQAADPKSANQTEQLFAEPQVQKFADEIQTQITRAVRRISGPDREQRVLASELPKLVKAVLTRPFAAYVEEVKPGPSGGVQAEAALVFNAGDQKKEVESAIEELIKLATEKGGPPLHDAAANGVNWRRLQTPEQAPTIQFGWKDEYLIVAVGAETPAKVLKRLAGSAPEWLTKMRAEHPVKREMSAGYIDVAGILERLHPIMDQKDPKAWPAVERLGLTSIRELHGVTGYDDVGCTNLAHLVTDGKRAGLLGLLPYKPLAAADLEIVPKDAFVAAATRLDAGEVWDGVQKLVVGFNPEAQEHIDQGLWDFENHLGVSLRDDVVGSLGDVWVVYLPGGDLLSSWFNAAAAVRVKDAAKLRESVGKIEEAAKGQLSRNEGRARIVESTIDTAAGKQTVHTLQFEEPAPVSPSWCITDKWVVVGLQPQAIRSALDRKADASLAQVEAVQGALGGETGPAAIFYQDTPALVRSAYPWVQIGAQMLSGQLRRQGIEVDASALPSLETIVKHLRPTISTMSHQDDGFRFTSIGSLPSSGGSVGAAPVAAALLLPAVGKARTAARDAQEINNLKQLALAALNHESATKTYPADICDKEGKPLLSWRVKVLPYLEQQNVYSQFHLDEPWDSEHNKALLEQMPDVFKSPGDERAGMTRYEALKGDKTVFRGKAKGMEIRRITDGTSMTLLYVRSSPDAAVEWTKPADVDYEASKPFAGLESPEGRFLTAFCDGSVRSISLAIPKTAMQALATSAGDEVIDQNSLDVPPGQHDDSADPEEEHAAKAVDENGDEPAAIGAEGGPASGADDQQ